MLDGVSALAIICWPGCLANDIPAAKAGNLLSTAGGLLQPVPAPPHNSLAMALRHVTARYVTARYISMCEASAIPDGFPQEGGEDVFLKGSAAMCEASAIPDGFPQEGGKDVF